MPKYSYIGTTIDGQEAKGVLNAVDVTDLEFQLANHGIYHSQAKPAFSNFGQVLVKHFGSNEITRSTRQLSILLKSKVSLIESMSLVAEQIKDKTTRSIFDNLIGQVESGRSLKDSLSDYPLVFDDLYVSMVEAGELSGKLDFSFEKLAEYREKSQNILRKVKLAMTYPLLVVAVAIAVVFALVFYVVPIFSSMYENFGAELPSLTKAVVETSHFLRESFFLWSTALFVIFLLVFYAISIRRVRTRLDKALVKSPYLGKLLTNIITARFSRTLGSLLISGVEIIYALEVAGRSTKNLHFRKLLETSAFNLIGGKSLTSVLEEVSLFPKTLIRLTVSGEKTGQLGEMLTYAADYFESETNTELTTLTSLIEPIVIIILGAVVAFILVAMYLPLFELVGTI